MWRRLPAGLVVRGENSLRGRDADYRVIPPDTKPEDLLISHISINFDRTGFQEDWNVVFKSPVRELAAEGSTEAAATHYSFMGATDGADGALCPRAHQPKEARRRDAAIPV
jgi:D-proline reductase (dithiol) PrdB